MNEHVHFHCCVIDEVFEPVVAPEEAPSVSFHAALELNAAALVLAPLELIEKIAALVPLQGAHRHRCYGVLAHNARLHLAVTAQALAAVAPASPSCRGPVSVGHAAGARWIYLGK